MKPAELYYKEKDKVRCLACAHKCLISEGRRGICKVRENVNGELILLVYGKVVSSNVDPIEKKPLYHFLKGSKSFSIGTVGCNFRCDFCQNWDISQASKQGFIGGRDVTPRGIVEEAIRAGCRSISYTYNEPVVFIEFVRDVARIAKDKGLKNIMVTNGYWSQEVFNYIYRYIDAVNIDLKGNEKFYNKYCGGNQKPVLDTIKRCYEAGIHIEITTLVIPGLNDKKEDFEFIAKFLVSLDKNIPWHISRFFPMYKMTKSRITPEETLEEAEKIGKKYLNYVYLGNI
ncbi:AmmeMemoRadiSam system radical SAM enzyme [Candidatus Pacearchaeota archaeon]|nr:AmmeMemoRadiSam system radical SAM enzyme [Candidatus Pacearchaeota archaeon]MBD3283686.1 AmmeMemoRadiSam system radical SAM enzyme [Candidatus Pacearchaeota archaeon]